MTTERIEPPETAGERETLETFLDYYRATLLVKFDGLSDDQVRERSVPPAKLSLLGLVRHMAEVERWWFQMVLDAQDVPEVYGDGEEDFDGVDEADPAVDRATFLAEIEAARATAARHDLEDISHHPRRGEVSLRWIYVHMIEEYARHCGHADFLRERIDGATGD